MRDAETKLPLPLERCLSEQRDPDAEARIWAEVRARRERRGGAMTAEDGSAELPLPLGDVLASTPPPLSRSSMWRTIQARRQGAARPQPLWKTPAFAMGVAVTALTLAVVAVQRDGTQQLAVEVGTPRLVQHTTGPLLTAEGTPLKAVRARRRERVVELADGSEITLQPGSDLEPLLSTGSRFEVLLGKGSAFFDVTPNGPRRWVIEAGLATVEVVGTRFWVDRGDGSVRVRVEHGIVLVRSDQLPNRVRRLTAGQVVEVRGPAPSAEAEAEAEMVFDLDPAELDPEAGDTEAVVYRRATPPQKQPAGSQRAAKTSRAAEADGASKAKLAATRGRQRVKPWRRHARAGRYKVAFKVLGRRGLEREVQRSRSVEQLLELADVARLSGHPRHAVAPLERVVAQHKESEHAALAAFTLGRLWLEQLKRPARAAQAFEQAIYMRPPHGLLADCHARLVEAHARAGHRHRARRAAERYRSLFPNGRHLADLERWTR